MITPDYLKELERQGKITRSKGKLPDDFWDTPFVKDPEGRFVQALLDEREEGR